MVFATYIEMAEKARETAFLRLLEHAAAAGGNAVIGINFTGQEILEGMTEVMAYGTAVTLVPTQQAPAPAQYSAPQQSAAYSQPFAPPSGKN
ncbi:hypothetical protein BGW38_004937 [Lunasporangiospora selenospora]|uniref:Heavy-metal-binding n=1 Tax=Lunasporangiospora selenospora TaxID=979761 RepID=A0A9P6KHF1_9FUNG|nr:hypothetical protein BGW38_004937 [Lunasporangiospora selenospora]